MCLNLYFWSCKEPCIYKWLKSSLFQKYLEQNWSSKWKYWKYQQNFIQVVDSTSRCLSCHRLLVYVTTKYIGLWKYQQKVDSRMLQSILRVLRSFTVNYLRMTQYWEKYVLTLFIKFHRCKNSKGNSTLLNDSKNVNYN